VFPSQRNVFLTQDRISALGFAVIALLNARMEALRMKRVDVVKWVATAVQLVGYGLTGLNIVPWNIFAFMIGIILWFLVGIMWKDRAIMVVHIGAFVAIVGGYLNS
jgi:hypothetical protein